jgi:hypothetical protein
VVTERGCGHSAPTVWRGFFQSASGTQAGKPALHLCLLANHIR